LAASGLTSDSSITLLKHEAASRDLLLSDYMSYILAYNIPHSPQLTTGQLRVIHYAHQNKTNHTMSFTSQIVQSSTYEIALLTFELLL